MPSSIAVVICAAGSSSRMGGLKKEYCLLDSSITVLGAVVRAFAAVHAVGNIVIAVPENDESAARRALLPQSLDGVNAGVARSKDFSIYFVTGGKTRAASVHNSLRFLVRHNPDFVLIHDGARPWVSADLILRTIEAVEKHGAAIPVIPLTDTPKECSGAFWHPNGGENGGAVFVKSHLGRSSTGIAQTPQGFKFPEILSAHALAAEFEKENREVFTDDAEIWGKFCADPAASAVAVIPGENKNRKITFPEDLPHETEPVPKLD